jgi:hypothetical protein
MLPGVVYSIRAVNTDSVAHSLADRDVENGRLDFPPYDGTPGTVVVLSKSVFDRHCGRGWLNREEYAKTLARWKAVETSRGANEAEGFAEIAAGSIGNLARKAHAAVCELRLASDSPCVGWDDLGREAKGHTIDGVMAVIQDPEIGVEALHRRMFRVSDGPYEDLPEVDRASDQLFLSLVLAETAGKGAPEPVADGEPDGETLASMASNEAAKIGPGPEETCEAGETELPANPLECLRCGRVFETKSGQISHEKRCKAAA